MASGVSRKMTTKNLPLIEIRRIGLEALKNALGPADMIRFLNDLQSGSGDYTKERGEWLHHYDVKKIAKEISEQ